mmetsp:Transcript_93034/g.207885  ORF Transcript_93034/g.207885 Transcript_93034/m.207885 type:complete len:360 (+) Transcript_93034:61-1140(+)
MGQQCCAPERPWSLASAVETDDLLSLKEVTPVQYEAIVRLQRNIRGQNSRKKTATDRAGAQGYDKQEHLGPFKDRYMIATNRPENDAHWDSEDPAWIGRASVSKRHRFLIRRDLHWRWFNSLVFGMIDSNGAIGDSSYCSPDAVAEVECMKNAALMYVENARESEGWSRNLGLFYHVYGHNSVNSMHLHIMDLDYVGPGYAKMTYKNCHIDVVLEVLREAAAASPIKGMVPMAADHHETEVVSGKRGAIEKSTFKADITAKNHRVNDAETFKEARACLWRMGGPAALKNALEMEGFLVPGSPKLTTGTIPFNVFARIAHQDGATRAVANAFGTLRASSSLTTLSPRGRFLGHSVASGGK